MKRREFLAGLVAVPIIAAYAPLVKAMEPLTTEYVFPDVETIMPSYRYQVVTEMVNELSDIEGAIEHLRVDLIKKGFDDVETTVDNEMVTAFGKKKLN